ncbi:shikimate O-hydroxycinnamoyltransferase [Microdochium nivale]|nr:shikimate O-hydroxycinnamoyltransferase [Microdochium nivale]
MGSISSGAISDAARTKASTVVVSLQSLQPGPLVEGFFRTTLSITDAVTSPVAGPECIWFYDDLIGPDDGLVAKLTVSLQATLVLVPYLAGRLEEIPFKRGGDWTERGGRLQAVYGSKSSPPGLQLTVLACGTCLSDIIPDAASRGRLWQSGLVPFCLFRGDSTPLALDDGHTLDNLPVAKVTITTFPCGSLAVAAKVVHPLYDAESLVKFMHTWSAMHANMFNGAKHGISELRLQPDLFMSYALGDINAPCPDPSITQVARELPLHRYDWWASADGCPPSLRWRTELQQNGLSCRLSCDPPSAGTRILWQDADLEASISSYTILFSRPEIEAMYLEATLQGTCGGLSTPGTISRLDALLAHIWALIVRARKLPTTDTVYANMALGFRSRILPPLPVEFVGCPATLAHAQGTASDADGSLATFAAAFRRSISSFTPTTISAFLHDLAHQVECRRYWGTSPSRHHITATSWLHNRMYDVDWGIPACRPRLVEPVMPAFLVCVTEGVPTERRVTDSKGQPSWYTNGATVSIHFESEVVERVINDPALRRFDSP